MPVLDGLRPVADSPSVLFSSPCDMLCPVGVTPTVARESVVASFFLCFNFVCFECVNISRFVFQNEV